MQAPVRAKQRPRSATAAAAAVTNCRSEGNGAECSLACDAPESRKADREGD